jgi:hypothetical protein
VQRRLRNLKKAKVIEVKRRGLTHTNLYVRLQLRHLHAVPDEAADTAEVRSPETATVRSTEAAAVRHEAYAVEGDAREEDTERSASRGADKSSPALRALVDELSDSHDGTYKVFAKAFLPQLHDGYFEFVLDQLLDDRRPYGIDGCPVESEAAIAYDTLGRMRAGPGLCGMPARYHRRHQEEW